MKMTINRLPGLLVAVLSAASVCHGGQVVLDGSFGTSGALAGPNYSIPASAGKTVGKNLFHSFSQFDLISGDVATFFGPASGQIQNVLARVTGGSVSSIDGMIQTDPATLASANFFFINPAGVMFGPNASINISGSFAVSTADYVKLADGARFVAKNPTVADDVLLTTASPVAFGFLGPSAAPISITGGDINLGEPPAALQVAEEKSVSLVGGDIQIINGQITAPSGGINCISVASAGEVALDVNDLLAPVDTRSFPTLGTVHLSDGSFFDASGSVRGGRVVVHAQDARLDNGSFFVAENSGTEPGLGIELNIRNTLALDASFVEAQSFSDSGDGGSIDIKASTISLNNGFGIDTDTLSAAKAGDITITTGSLEVSGGVISATASGPGHGGDIHVTASSVRVDGAAIGTTTFGGPAGNIFIQTKSLEVANAAEILSEADASSPGGSIQISADSVALTQDGRISVSSFGSGDAGSIRLTANSLHMDGEGQGEFTGIRASTESGGGRGGDIAISPGTEHTLVLEIANGAQISASTTLSGDGGQIDLHGGRLTLENNGSIQSAATGPGNAGSISLFVSGAVLLQDNSSISVSADQMNAGTITIQAGSHLTLNHSSSITASAGVDGGNIEVHAQDFVSLFKSQITASAGNDGGNILIDPNVVTLNQSQIIANAILGNGGNIDIISDFFLNSSSLVQAKTENQFALQGSVEIAAPDVDLSGSLIPLSSSLISAESQLRERCAVRVPGGVSSFFVVGRGGLPVEPDRLLPTFQLSGKRTN